MSELIYPKLSYKVMGVLFKVHNKLGPAYQEKYYQRAVEAEFQEQKIPYEKEKMVGLEYGDKKIGKYFIDFVVEDAIALEFKTVEFFRRKDIRQVLAYLDATNLKLAILVNFNSKRLRYMRVVNPRVKIANGSESQANKSK